MNYPKYRCGSCIYCEWDGDPYHKGYCSWYKTYYYPEDRCEHWKEW